MPKLLLQNVYWRQYLFHLFPKSLWDYRLHACHGNNEFYSPL